MVAYPLPRAPQPAPGWLDPGVRVYAVGDVHGCAGRLDALHNQIAADLAARPVAAPLLIHLGDYIDRGPDSAGVVARLAAGPPIPGLPTTNLRGNHEQMMLGSLRGDPGAVAHWKQNGAAATLESWGIAARAKPRTWEESLPVRHVDFLHGLALNHRVGGYVFVHAGFRPGVPFRLQNLDDMLWIRDEFLDCDGPVLPDLPDCAVVHGHTPVAAPEVLANRINVDTGAVRGGPLTCAVLEGRTVGFLTA